MANHLVQNLQQLYRLFVVAFIASLTLVACSDNSSENQVTGGADAEILNLQDSTIRLYSEVYPLDLIQGATPDFNEYIDVDSNGIFLFSFMFPEGFYYLEYDKNKVKYFIQEGKRLSVDFDAKKAVKKPDFSGKMKYESRYLFDKHIVLAKFESNLPFHFSLNETEFLDVLSLLRNKLDKMLVLYITNRPVGSEYFMKQESLSNLYYVATIAEKYKIQRAKYYPNLPVSDTLTQLTQQLSLNDTNAIENTNYFNFIKARVWLLAGYPSTKQLVYRQLQFIDSAIVLDSYKNYLYFNTGREVAKWDKSDTRDAVIDTLLYSITDVKVKQFLVEKLRQDTITVIVNDSLTQIQK